MLRNRWRRARVSTMIVVACLAGGTSVAVGQAAPTVQLRYHPRVGSLIATRSDMDVTMTFIGLPALPDSETASLTMRVSTSRRVLSQSGGSYRVRYILDSARASSRVASTPRRDVNLPFDGTNLELLVDSVMQATPAPDTGRPPLRPDTAALAFARAVEPLFKLPLPPRVVGKDSTWAMTQLFPLSDLMVSGVPGAATGPRTMVAHIIAKVDSLVPRGTDTLAYVSYNGQDDPVTVATADSAGRAGTMVVRGGMAASQIWSTSWSGWVAAGMRSRVEMKLHGPGPGGAIIDATIITETTGRMAVHL